MPSTSPNAASPAPGPRRTSRPRTSLPAALFQTWDSPLGRVLLAATPRGLCGLWFEGQRHGPDADAWPRLSPGSPEHARASDHLGHALGELQAYFQGARTEFLTPLDCPQGTAFQQAVWRALRTIGSGQTTTYRGLAEQLGRPLAVRAVGAAVGRNPLSILVPCHRVLGSDGSLTGYAGGLPRKAALLKREAGQ